MRWLLPFLLCSACQCRPQSTPSLPVEHKDLNPSKSELRILFSGHEEADCPNEQAWGSDLSGQLVHLAETVEMPPWAGIRAAKCFMDEYSAQSSDTLFRWVSDPRWAGLGAISHVFY